MHPGMRAPGLVLCLLAACGGDDQPMPDAGTTVSTEKCNYVPLSPTANASGMVAEGALMAGALLGSLPVAVLYSFFVEYYVSGMTGAVKE